MRKSLAWLLVVCLLLPGCASRSVPPIGAGGQPFKPDSDERALWAKAEKEEEALLKKAKAYDDPLLEDYLAKVGERLTPDDVRNAGGPGFKFGVLRDPTLNAFALPNGHIYVHTGLLSRLDNESQLAMIVGHEMTHVTHRHALSFQRDAQTKQILYTVGAVAASIGVAAVAGSRAQKGDYVGAAVIGQTANAILGLGLALTTMAAINGYGRDLERDADQGGMENLVRAGYDPKEAPKVFALLRSESKDRGSLETFFFGSHPKLTERIETTQGLLKTKYAGAKTPTRTSAPDASPWRNASSIACSPSRPRIRSPTRTTAISIACRPSVPAMRPRRTSTRGSRWRRTKRPSTSTRPRRSRTASWASFTTSRRTTPGRRRRSNGTWRSSPPHPTPSGSRSISSSSIVR